jgi:hypothetical protein
MIAIVVLGSLAMTLLACIITDGADSRREYRSYE